ncbi:16S rRNA (cytosine(1402)-N(4))-methyltransferase RsmH [Candidatus Omnitrophota bacterium]
MSLTLHNPALLEEVIHFLNPVPGNIIIDATIGGAGHAEEIMPKLWPGGMLIGIDRDSESLRIAHERLTGLKGQFKLVNKNFRDLKKITQDLKIGEIDGIVFDVGISSIQMETAERGFSIKHPGPLDMRMDRNQSLTAKDLVNSLSEIELSDLIRNYGEERFHRRIAKGIVAARKRKEIQSTFDLADIVLSNIPYGNRRKRRRIHPATRTFQAFRIRVNDELVSLEEALGGTPDVLKKGGRVSIISFHSLEDRIVKNILKKFNTQGIFRTLTKKPIRAKEEEILKNPRARSAKLRAAVKL